MCFLKSLFRAVYLHRVPVRNQRSFWSQPNVCIIGSGPSAFYTAQYLLKQHKHLRIDMYEKLPAPFGLVRYGVAPDHPDVKNVINTFTEVAKNPRFKFIGNVSIGTNVRLKELRSAYASVILAYGAAVDRRMNIPGEDLSGVLSAKNLVGWYNGSPDLNHFSPDLDCDTVSIVGMGNVAIDVARILLSPLHRLRSTDIPEPVVATLSASRVKRVWIIGRRGPLQAAFTLKEFRELTQLRMGDEENSQLLDVHLLPKDIIPTSFGSPTETQEVINSLRRPRRRLSEFLVNTATSSKVGGADMAAGKSCDLLFLRSPVQVLQKSNPSQDPNKSSVAGIELQVNKLQGDIGPEQSVIADSSAPLERISCGLVIRSIGYRSIRIDPDLPFDEERGVIACRDNHGRVAVPDEEWDDLSAGGLLYCAGWAKRGPVGVIVDTAVDARATAMVVLQDLAEAGFKHAASTSKHLGGNQQILELLKQRNIQPVSFADWERVDRMEQNAGHQLGKPREKFTSIQALLHAAFDEVARTKNNTPLE